MKVNEPVLTAMGGRAAGTVPPPSWSIQGRAISRIASFTRKERMVSFLGSIKNPRRKQRGIQRINSWQFP
jgi:hypothetical protein